MPFKKPNTTKETETNYKEDNRFVLFYQDSPSDKIPSHKGRIVFTQDMIEEYGLNEDGEPLYIMSLTGWQKESGLLNGVCKSYSEHQKSDKGGFKGKKK